MSPHIRIRQAQVTDVANILAIGQSSPEAPQWRPERFLEALVDQSGALQQRTLFVAEIGPRLVGFVMVSATAGEAELESVAVALEQRRKGLGRKLCEAALAWAKSNGAQQMWLEVRASNEGAQALYRQLGFEVTGTRRNYYAGPLEDAVLMKAELHGTGHL